MKSLISHLSSTEQVQLLDELNYLNMAEIKRFCEKHSIPYSIWIETKDGQRRKSRDIDRKGVILDRIRHYLRTGQVLEATCFPATVVCFDDLRENIKPTDRLFYGQYDKKSRAMIGLLEKLTGGQFRNGAIARILAREFWSQGVAPSFEDFALAWLEAQKNHNSPNAEWAFLSDRSKGEDTTTWKHLRTTKADRVLSILNPIGIQAKEVPR